MVNAKCRRLKIALAYLISVPLAILPVYRTYAVLPTICIGLIFAAAVVAVCLAVKEGRFSLGNKHYWVPASVIILVVFLQVITGGGIENLAVIVLFGSIYIGATNLQDHIFKPLAYAVIIGSISCVALYFIEPYLKTGGIYSDVNYNIAAHALLLGVVLSPAKYRYILLPVALLGVFFTGAEEGVFALFVLAVAILVRRDFSKKMVYTFGALAIIAALIVPLDVFNNMWGGAVTKLEVAGSGDPQAASGYRWENVIGAISTIKILGNGYEQISGPQTVHNVPLMILYQMGPVAALAWVWAMGYGIFRSRVKYAFITVAALSMFDNIMWYTLAPYTWVLWGIASQYSGDDYVFRYR